MHLDTKRKNIWIARWTNFLQSFLNLVRLNTEESQIAERCWSNNSRIPDAQLVLDFFEGYMWTRDTERARKEDINCLKYVRKLIFNNPKEHLYCFSNTEWIEFPEDVWDHWASAISSSHLFVYFLLGKNITGRQSWQVGLAHHQK